MKIVVSKFYFKLSDLKKFSIFIYMNIKLIFEEK